jgi:hypothetical protein
VFTPRRANVPDFLATGCRKVSLLNFAYDPELIGLPFGIEPPGTDRPDHDVLFVGGADRDRVPIIAGLIEAGLRVRLIGAYWRRYPQLASFSPGTAEPRTVALETRAAPVNLCLVRRANRDGHVMRSYEIAAAGGFAVVEDTPDHRDIYGPEGQCVLYFTNTQEAAAKIQWALDNPGERHRMQRAAHNRVTQGANTYADRLEHILRSWST